MKKRIICAIALLSFGLAFSQETTSKILGRLKGSNSEVTVRVTHLPTNSTFETKSNNKGIYSLDNLQPGGPYKIEITEGSNLIYSNSNLQLSLGNNDLPVVEVNSSKEKTIDEVKLTANKKTAVKYGVGISQSQISGLPNINRGIQDVTKLIPQSANNSFNGTNFRYNNVTIDGSINNDAIGFSPSLGGQTGTSGMPGSSTRSNSISLDAIQDVQVYIAPYDVKLGNFLGGSINAVTRSGSNNVDGSIYFYGRNAAITGKNRVGDNSKMPSSFEDYITGGRIGLPVVKDKVFLFTNFEYTKRTDPVFYNAGEPGSLVDNATAAKIARDVQNRYGFDIGSYNQYNNFSESGKLFTKLDWKLNDKHSLSIKNNTVFSQASNLERDGANFRFSSIDFTQRNTASTTTLELKSRFNSKWSNNLIVGYSSIHDYRDPSSQNKMFPQVEISYNGGTILFGNDREATVFNMKQKTFEITNNLTYKTGIHNFLLGTHNELYNIDYGFVNALNGRISYKNLDDFFASKPARIRGTYPFNGDNRETLFNNPYAHYKVNMLSLYLQDEINLGRLRLSPGIRVDYTDLPNKPQLSPQVNASPNDPNFGNTYTYTPLNQLTNKYLSKPTLSPRLGFNLDITENKSVVLRGGSGIFVGRIPFAWLGYAYYNDGVGFGSYDYNSPTPAQLTTNGDPLVSGNFAKWQNSSKVQVDLIDNNFKMPRVWRSSLALDYTLAGYKLTLEGIYTKVIYDLMFQQVNKTDKVTYYSYDTNHEMPVYTTNINSNFSNAYMLSNTKEGYRYNLTVQLAKSYNFGFNFFAAYTYGDAKDITNGIRNSMESNWQMNQSLTPNNPALATSNFAIKNRIVANLGYGINLSETNRLSANVYFNAQSGNPFSWGFVNSTIANTGQAAGLAYIFKNAAEAAKYLVSYKDGAGNTVSVQQQVSDYENFINSNKYLSSRRGKFTERNGDFTPWNVQADFRIMDEIKLSNKNKNTIQISFSIMNITNLLNKDWGKVYFVPNTFNSTASVGLTKVGNVSGNVPEAGDPTYNFKTPGTPYTIDQFASRFQGQLGIRYNF
ncbi:TonB-dependent receptor [Elizabethkingia anophelis]|uniref:TonB-dependent receptor n=1 Tax=Elizabethkingia anophelis TaxID=1117645 RepID=UPI00063AD1A4|nr:TonB-dependent receptor [Elizabethkingia anophelis]AKH95653.1 TonB-dependent receptor [Elizabethkingia anophelis FMS-007]MDV3926639.1 TonB-dependent receptor [Elizabethkingia anophelis]MDV4025661.1 TonB-dependent receptor [Elizabethkingia anophelis]